jgi:conjugative relaxase-like TrwC/TraI family protein
MLRIVQQSNAAAAKSYYAKADYYIEGAELPGEWGGRAAALLGLSGEVTEAAFQALCDNRHPQTGRPLTARTKEKRTVLYDWSFDAPKAVSLLYELAGDERILEVFRSSVRETMAEAEGETKARVRKSGAAEDRTTGNLVHATFVHRTSRPSKEDLKPDPQLHAHVCVMNATWDAAERQWKAVQMRDLKRDAPYWQEAFHARLAIGLAKLGYGIERRGKDWTVAGISPALSRKFSRRNVEITRLAEQLGITDPARKAALGATSRLNKTEAGIESLRAYWNNRLTPAERAQLDGVRRAAEAGVSPARAVTAEEAVRHATLHHFERDAVVPEKRLYAEALKYGIGVVTPEAVRAEAARQGVFTATLDGQRVASTAEVLAEEQRLLAFARDGRGTRAPIAAKHRMRRDWLNADQQRAVRHVLGSPDRVVLVRGVAGTGKTTLTQEAVEAATAAGLPVAVLAPTALAARDVLRGEGFAEADTVASFLGNARTQERVRGGVIWVDEAGLLGVRDLARLIDAAERQDARVVLVGDSKQHGSVARGPALTLLETHAGLPVAEVKSIRRQKAAYKEAVNHLAAGRTADGFTAFEALGWVREVEDAERNRALATDYLSVLEEGKTALVVSPTHREGEAVTAAIRALRKDRRQLGEERAFTRLVPLNLTEAERADPHAYRGGEVVQFVRNAKGHAAGSRLTVAEPAAVPAAHAGRFQAYREEALPLAAGDVIRLTAGGKATDGTRLSNGATFTVRGFTEAGGIRLDSGKTLPADFGHLAHGYVTTSHAAQGRTVDRVLVAQSAASLGATTREQFYVSASRARGSMWLYTDDKAALKEAIRRAERRVSATDLVRKTRPPRPLTRRVTFLSRLATLARARREHAPERTQERDAAIDRA